MHILFPVPEQSVCKTDFYPESNFTIDQEKAHTYQDQTDCKNPAQFLTDSAENKVIFYNRNRLRRTLAKSHAEPTACSDGKQ